MWFHLLDIFLYPQFKGMKIEYSVKHSTKVFDFESWLRNNEPKIKTSHLSKFKGIQGHYNELIDEFKNLLMSAEKLTDSDGIELTPIEVYNAIEYYKIRIQKLWLIFGLRLYKTINVNKESNVRYIVMRAFWIDDKGRPFRKFSKNLGAENKVLVKGTIPQSDIVAVEDYIISLMWDLYYYEYISDDDLGYDKEGNVMIIQD